VDWVRSSGLLLLTASSSFDLKVRQVLFAHFLLFGVLTAFCADLETVPPFKARFSQPSSLFISAHGTNDFDYLSKSGLVRNELEFNALYTSGTNRYLCQREGLDQAYSNPFKEKKVDIGKLQTVRTSRGLIDALGEPESRIGPWGPGSSVLWIWGFCDSARNTNRTLLQIAASIDWDTRAVQMIAISVSTNDVFDLR
jgi:hypothetical protein